MTRPLVDVIREIWERQDSAGVPRFAVFPCSRSKKPFYRSGHKYGHGHNSATTDIDIACDMFLDFSIDTHYIGIAGGAPSGGIFALDIDIKNPATPDRMRDLSIIEDVIRIQFGDLPKTAIQSTPSGGRHYLFRGPDIGNVNDFFIGAETGVFSDVKGNGGYFVLYDYDIDFDLIADAPEWISEHFGEKSKEKSDPFIPGEIIQSGARNVRLTQAAGKFWSFGLAPEYMLPYLTGLNNLYCKPPLAQKEIERIAQSAIENFDREWEQTEIKRIGFNESILTFKDFLEPQPPIEWIIDDLVASETLAMFYGDAGCGKTWLLLYAMVCIATGQEFVGKKTKQGAVLLIDEESGKHRLSRRFQKIAANLEAGKDTPVFSISMKGVDLKDFSIMQSLLEFICENNIKLIVLDALMDLIPGADENSVKEVQPAFQNCKKIIEQTGATFVFIHHSKKDGKNFRGTSSIKGAVDLMVNVDKSQSSDIMKIHIEKNRDGELKSMVVKLYFSDVDFRIEKFEGKSENKINETEKFILEFLLKNGDSFKSAIESAGKIENIKNVKKTIYNLIERGLIIRKNPIGGKDNKAVISIVAEKIDDINALITGEICGNIEDIV